jgi:hypothetical protein
MTRRYPHYLPPSLQPSDPADQPRLQWWRPLTTRWGILGVIIFIGLVFSLLDEIGRRTSQQLASSPATPSPVTRAAELDRQLPPSTQPVVPPRRP